MSRTVTALDLGGTHVVAGRVDLGTGTVDRGPRFPLPDDASRAEAAGRDRRRGEGDARRGHARRVRRARPFRLLGRDQPGRAQAPVGPRRRPGRRAGGRSRSPEGRDLVRERRRRVPARRVVDRCGGGAPPCRRRDGRNRPRKRVPRGRADRERGSDGTARRRDPSPRASGEAGGGDDLARGSDQPVRRRVARRRGPCRPRPWRRRARSSGVRRGRNRSG